MNRENAIPKTLGKARYEVRAVIGRGASGEVFRVHDRKAAREVALKRLLRSDPDDAFSMKREFRALADVRHPNLIELYDLWAEGGTWFYTMELIEGSDFVSYVGGARSDRDAAARCERVTVLLPQLASGLAALHSAGVLHRDLKPQNILVETRGELPPRLVLLDFSLLASAVPDPRDRAIAPELVGAVAYMAPEQLSGTVTEASDWYAAGVVLHEALSGALPFDGKPREIASAKRSTAAPRLDEQHTPRWLADLVAELLAPAPAARPEYRRIVAALGASGAASPGAAGATLHAARRVSAWSAGAREAKPFHGRAAEMQALAGCLEGAPAAGRLVVHVCGESGIGKSELLVRALDAVERDRKALVFRGRCHPHESIPYKALDQIVDDLSRHLRLDSRAAADVEPARLGALVRLFPVLARVAPLAGRCEDVSQLEPGLVRQHGARGLRDLLTAIAAERPVLLWIDDAQWGDADSVEILETLVEAANRTPGRALIVVLSYRPEGRASSPVVRALAPGRCAEAGAACFVLAVEPLSGDDASALAIELLRARGIDDPEAAAAVAREAGGSPFFIGELARSDEDLVSVAAARPRAGHAGMASVVHRRFERLRGPARHMLEVVALAGAPLEESLALRAAGMDQAGAADVDELERSCLLRTYEGSDERVLQPYHDRIAEAVRETLEIPRQRALHGAIAAALEGRADAEPELLVFHYRGAQAMALAARHAAVAARRALDALAFDRAAEMFELAARHSSEDVARAPLWSGLADSLAGAGRGQEAARAFESAADSLAGSPANEVSALDYRRRAAEQLIKCGQVERGIGHMREVLAVFGERLPETPGEALRSFVWQRLRLLRRGMEFRRRAQAPLRPLHVARLDAVWATSVGISMVNPSLSVALSTRHLIEVLDSGDVVRICQALAAEASWRASIGRRLGRSAGALLDMSRDLAQELGTPYERAWAAMGMGVASWQSARFPEAIAPLETALALYRNECRGAFFEIALSNMYFFGSLALSGEIARLRAAVVEEAATSERRNDRLALHGALLGDSVLGWLADGDADSVIERADAAIAEWPAGSFQTQNFHHLNTTVQAEIYRGRGERAYARIEAEWPRLVRGGYLFLECVSLGLRFLRGRAALAAALTASAERRRSLLRTTAADARRISRSKLGVAPVYANLLRAGLAAAAGDDRGRTSSLHAAHAAAAQRHMPLHVAAASIAFARTCNEPAVMDAARKAREWMAGQGIAEPQRMAAMITLSSD